LLLYLKRALALRKKGLAKKKMTQGWPKAMNGWIPTDNQWLVHMWLINVPSSVYCPILVAFRLNLSTTDNRLWGFHLLIPCWIF
jgi:hypothetical protein